MATGLGSQTRQARRQTEDLASPGASRPWVPGIFRKRQIVPAWAIAALRGIISVAEMGEQIRNRETGEG
ncbi:MAG TPA: hypothetical protein DCQ13_01940 [Firmicutes bacterium]|nr:hypothetical protein [Bacillota bacterium]